MSLAAAVVMMSSGGPEWISVALLWICFAAVIPIVFAEFRRDWQTMCGYLALFGPIRLWAMPVGTTVLVILLIVGGYPWLRSEIGWLED